jgi:hypothetical protein
MARTIDSLAVDQDGFVLEVLVQRGKVQGGKAPDA